MFAFVLPDHIAKGLHSQIAGLHAMRRNRQQWSGERARVCFARNLMPGLPGFCRVRVSCRVRLKPDPTWFSAPGLSARGFHLRPYPTWSSPEDAGEDWLPSSFRIC